MLKLKKESYFAFVIVLAMLSWGGSWTSAKAIPASVPSEIVVFWRFFITFISFIPIIIFLKQPLYINRSGIYQVLIGAAFLVVYNFLFINGVREGQAGAGGVIVTTLNPLFTFMISAFVFKHRIKRKETLGLTLGLIGGAILFQIWNLFNSNFMNGADSLFFLAALSWAFLSVITQKSKLNMSPFIFSFYIYGIAALFNFFMAIPNGLFNISQVSSGTWLNIIYLSLLATTFGTTAYFYAASKLGANKASSFTFLVPSSAVFFSWLFLNEAVNLITIIGGMLALIAVYIINYQNKYQKMKR